MKIRTLIVALAITLMLPTAARADEGMWLLSLIGKNYSDMQKAGFKLTPEDIYSVNQSCLKDAIVGLGNAGNPFWHFCTGEIISNQGLMSTNHHCGYEKLQQQGSAPPRPGIDIQQPADGLGPHHLQNSKKHTQRQDRQDGQEIHF